MEILAKVNPNTIVIDPRYVRPSEWDLVVVLDDLRAFVTVTRLIKATPILEPVNGGLRLVNGEPFVRAAQEAEPPLQEIFCLIKTDQVDLDESLFIPVSPTALMEQFPEQDLYEAFELLSFVFPVADRDKAQIEQEIRGFFATVHEQPSVYGGSYRWISDLRWDDIEHRVSWVWERNDLPGQHQQLFLDLLRRIDTRIVRLRSWNGLALHLSK
jgi:hypothetical protein